MEKKISLNFITLTAFFVATYIVYYILLSNTSCSIKAYIAFANHTKHHFLILGLLPFYIGAVIFGAALLGVYLGSALDFLRNRCTIKAK